ncbi:ChuX/HutX family heme-like substrate-binding protein [uncultured Maritimibacter sp.]|jgi:putative hemin transport protein|uniref:hemin-degrading factor n=1 Tax=uncultured Maritimibacter sp. TaxID=991866 RepID=UPI000A582777|nr:ChuX/HutX family heme-like substrate-binding protein [uncultured Maritimibacter sp.]
MPDTASLSARDIRAALADNTTQRARELASSLGISEAQLVAANVGHGTTRLSANPDDIMGAVPALGEVMALTRTPSVVHEKVGAYANYHSGQHASMVLADDIDLRIFPQHWVSAFAVETATDKGVKRSIQVFDAAGDAVHKIHLRDGSNHDQWAAVVASLAHADQSDLLAVADRVPPSPPMIREDKADDLRAEWRAMTDTHQFALLTRRLKMNRLGAYRVAGAPFVRRLVPGAVDTLLMKLAQSGVPCMIFVGNHGCIQIHSGPIATLKQMGPWNNVMDPGFNLHLRSDHIAEVYEVRKPTKRGEAISVEGFDADGALILQIFGMRKENADYVPAYDGLVASLESEEVTA